ncbi:RNA 2',3'-cyclic phosphodiesterase [Candidatus Woesearchaeota archaeon]|nr:RNA 2',3'-cyclic phosphodiesterase [Candidatus Woesearchaeota archaeon]
MRLFIAIDPPGPVREQLALIQRSLPLPGLRHVPPKNIHLTLAFLGEQDPERVKNALRTITFNPFTLTLAGIGSFPDDDNPNVIWAGLEDNEELLNLQRQISRRFKPDKTFKAHLTLSRMKRATPAQRAAIIKTMHQLRLERLSFEVNSFKLYRTTLTPTGPVYKALATYDARPPDL